MQAEHEPSANGWIEVLLYVTADRRITLEAYGSGHLPRVSQAFGSAVDFGRYLAALLADPRGASHPVLQALRAAARAMPREPNGDAPGEADDNRLRPHGAPGDADDAH